MPLDGESIKIRGLSELRRELAKLDDKTIIDELKDVHYNIAQLGVNAAQAQASSRMEQSAAQSLKPGRQAARAVISFGGPAFAMGAEFGAGQNVPRTAGGRRVRGWNQFKPWRGSGEGAGYFLFPGLRSRRDEFVEMEADGMIKVLRHAFPD